MTVSWRFGLIGILLAHSPVALAENGLPPGPDNSTQQVFLRNLERKASYGLHLAAPHDAGCRQLNYAVFDADNRLLGATGPLRQGEIGVIRLGKGTSSGQMALMLRVRGCAALPAAIQVIRLAKPSPDHGNSAMVARARLQDPRVASLSPAAPDPSDTVTQTRATTSRGLASAGPPPLEDRRRCKKGCAARGEGQRRNGAGRGG
jgi:hypothetical protein